MVAGLACRRRGKMTGMKSAKENIQNEIKELETKLEKHKRLCDHESDRDMLFLLNEEIAQIEGQIKALSNSLLSLNEDYPKKDEGGGSENQIINPNSAILTVMVEIKGKDCYNLLKNESGVHRVQRVPTTEAGGRIHTSTATVAVLPIVSKIEIEIKPEDVKMDFFRAGGHGGQNVNKVSTAVRLTHIPTGLVVECQEERSQGKNREKAMNILKSRIFNMMQKQQVKNIADLRAGQVGTGDRSEKIRTYNYPQDRITDHRLLRNWHNMNVIMNGGIDDMLLETSQISLASSIALSS